MITLHIYYKVVGLDSIVSRAVHINIWNSLVANGGLSGPPD